MSDSSEVKEVSTRHLGRIYYVLEFLKKARIAETVNRCVPDSSYCVYVEGKGFICFTLGQIFEIMVLNRLDNLKSPMYHVGEWCENTAIPEIYGIPSELLNDDRIGRFLDKIFPYIATIDSKITMNMIKEFGIEISKIHFDPSSFKVYGEYLPTAGETSPIEITYGRDGQGRRDDKLVRFGIAITEDCDFPLIAKGYSGNASDSEMHPEFLTELRKMLGTSDFLFIADSKLDSKANIGDIFFHKGSFLCPGAFLPDIKEAFISKYRKKHKFERLEYVSKSERKKAKNKRNYFEAFERMQKIVVKGPDGKKRTYQYRLIFVYSSMKAKTEAKTRGNGITKVRKELYTLASRLNKKNYETHQEITVKLGKILKRPASKFFDIKLREENSKFSISFEIDEEKVENSKILDGVYILKTNLPKKKYTINDVMEIYKKQGRIESRIADIKGPLQVAPIYLKKEERILSLFTIIIQALKIYTLIEREVHQAVEEQKEAIPILPENRRSERPKASTILRIFDDHTITLVTITYRDGSCTTHLTSLSEKQKMLFQFIKRRPPDRRTFSRKIGVYKNRPRSTVLTF